MADTRLPRKRAQDNNVSLGKRKLAIFVLTGGLYCNVTHLTKYVALLPDIQNLDAIQGSPINERQHFELGFEPITINDGYDFAFAMEIEGNSRYVPAWLVGQQLHLMPAMDFGRDYGIKGHLIVYNVDENDTLVVCDVILDVAVKLSQLPGGQDGENNLSIELYANDTELISVALGHKVSSEFFVDNANDANADAPDGLITTFTLGDGNRSYAVKAPPTTLVEVRQNRPTPVTGLYKYFLWLRVNGVDVSDAEATFNPATKVLTFGVAPAAEAFLEMGYVVDKAGVGPLGEPAHLWAGSSLLDTPDVFMIA